ncbi:lamin tail domain-containing protein [Nakamurella sp. GG22]
MSIPGRSVVVAVLLTLLMPLLSVTDAAAAAAPVRITKVFYDPPGKDTRVNARYNLEYVVITNTSSKSQSLTGWTLTDKQNHVYKFPAFTLGARKSVTVRTGKGTANATTRFYNSGNYIWNNTGDTATLKNKAGKQVSTCGWTKGTSSGYKNC